MTPPSKPNAICGECKKGVAKKAKNELPTVFDYSIPKWESSDGENKMTPACTKEENEAWAKSMALLFGTKDKDNMLASLGHITAVVGHKDNFAINGVMAQLKAIDPADELEGMLAIQMVGIHYLSMTMMGRAVNDDQPSDVVQDQVNRITKLTRTFIAQLEALNKHRGKGQQKMTVEHVYVGDGGQAVIGNVGGGRE